ncbi:hypothetical protein L3V82_12935 [Thiotrichales bacterium 19S3-7]|nr:hypothetical protein [Thiotrichales bacterium 19S3-7]MCF6803078.1 hypothetical protein [Thiotrichales bacterium 19S3-11]
MGYWRAELKEAQTSLSNRLNNGHVDSFSQNGASMQYNSLESLRKHISFCEYKVALYESISAEKSKCFS